MKRKEKKMDHRGGFQGALCLQSTTIEGEEFRLFRWNGDGWDGCESGWIVFEAPACFNDGVEESYREAMQKNVKDQRYPK